LHFVFVICLCGLSPYLFAQDPNFHIYLCLGQSNMEGHAPIEAQDTVGVDERFRVLAAVDCADLKRTQGQWYTAVPPLARCRTGLSPADYFGRAMVAALPTHVRVGVINVAVGGCRIELFDKNGFESYIANSPDWLKNTVKAYDNDPYARLLAMAKLAQRDGVIKGILLHQGESNTGDADWPVKVKGVYEQLIGDLGLNPLEVPLLAGEVVHQNQNGKCASMNHIISTLPQVIPNSMVVSSDGCEAVNDQLHFSANGYRELGKRYAHKMLEWLNGQQ
jgi:alpha-L-fucosidase 2